MFHTMKTSVIKLTSTKSASNIVTAEAALNPADSPPCTLIQPGPAEHRHCGLSSYNSCIFNSCSKPKQFLTLQFRLAWSCSTDTVTPPAATAAAAPAPNRNIVHSKCWILILSNFKDKLNYITTKQSQCQRLRMLLFHQFGIPTLKFWHSQSRGKWSCYVKILKFQYRN